MPLLASFNRVAFSIQSCRPSLAHSIGSSGMAGSQRDHLFSRRGVGHLLICVTMAWCSIGSVAADEGLVTLTKLERHSIEAGQRKINLEVAGVAKTGAGLTAATATNVREGSLRSDMQDDEIKKLILPGESFLVEGRPAFILWPDEAKRSVPQPWVMYAPTLPGYPDSHEKWMHEQFLEAGIAVAGIDMDEAYGSPKGSAGMTALYKHLTGSKGFASRPVLLGRSRGGLWVSSWAIEHPEKVAGIIAIYPVFDLTTYPGLERAAPAYGLDAAGLEARLSEFNPIARAGVLGERGIPFAIIHGDQDTVVPLEPNSLAMKSHYEKAGNAERMHLEVVPGQGHNYWEGFFRSQTLVDKAIGWLQPVDGHSSDKASGLNRPEGGQ